MTFLDYELYLQLLSSPPPPCFTSSDESPNRFSLATKDVDDSPSHLFCRIALVSFPSWCGSFGQVWARQSYSGEHRDPPEEMVWLRTNMTQLLEERRTGEDQWWECSHMTWLGAFWFLSPTDSDEIKQRGVKRNRKGWKMQKCRIFCLWSGPNEAETTDVKKTLPQQSFSFLLT